MSRQEVEITEIMGSEEMFASVWVKVEMDDDEENEKLPNCNDRLESQDEQNKTEDTSKRKLRNRKVLSCNQCEYTTAYKNCLQLHMMGHCNIKPYNCEFCDYTSKYPNAIQRHIIIQHKLKSNKDSKEIRLHKCSDCNYTTVLKWNLKAHSRKHKLDKQFQCSHCDYKTAYRHNFIKHGKVHNKKELLFQCDKCNFSTKFEGHITRHLAQIHKEVVEKANKCEYCDFATRVRWRLNIHLKKSLRQDVIKCGYCSFETNYVCASKKHRVTHYNEIYGNYRPINSGERCEKTDEEIFNTDIDMEPEYQTLHEKSNNYTLDPKREVDWKNIKVIESDNKLMPFKCFLCAYTSKYKASVQRHFQRQHTGNLNRPYKCVNCDFSTKTKDQISLHNKRSQSTHVIQCAKCNFTTNFKCQYIMHQKTHHKFKCNSCDYSCMNKYEFQRHYSSVHLGTGLKCQYCEYVATRKESLLCHMTIHTGDKPFKCQNCEYMSVRKSLLDIHTKKYHSDIVKDVTVVSVSKIESLIVNKAPDNEDLSDVLAEFSTQITEGDHVIANY